MRLRNRFDSGLRAMALMMGICVAVLTAGACRLKAEEPYKPYNEKAAKLKNPVESNEKSIEAGRQLYKRHCASCHGAKGKGDGGQALSGGEPSDLTDETWDTGSTDGEIFAAIRDGLSADMLAYKDKLKDKEIWQIVVFVRSLAPPKKAE